MNIAQVVTPPNPCEEVISSPLRENKSGGSQLPVTTGSFQKTLEKACQGQRERLPKSEAPDNKNSVKPTVPEAQEQAPSPEQETSLSSEPLDEVKLSQEEPIAANTLNLAPVVNMLNVSWPNLEKVKAVVKVETAEPAPVKLEVSGSGDLKVGPNPGQPQPVIPEMLKQENLAPIQEQQTPVQAQTQIQAQVRVQSEIVDPVSNPVQPGEPQPEMAELQPGLTSAGKIQPNQTQTDKAGKADTESAAPLLVRSGLVSHEARQVSEPSQDVKQAMAYAGQQVYAPPGEEKKAAQPELQAKPELPPGDDSQPFAMNVNHDHPGSKVEVHRFLPVNAHSRQAVDPQDLMAQIVKKAELIVKQESAEMTIQLKPGFLGKMTIKILVDDAGAITAHFTTSSQQVKNALEQNIQALRQNLEAQGMKVDKAEVNVQLDSGGMLNDSGSRQQELWQQPRSYSHYRSANSASDSNRVSDQTGEPLYTIGSVLEADYSDNVNYLV